MRIACLGGGPAGLYFAIAMKLRDPAHEITVVERNRPYDTFGWGVVLSDETLANLRSRRSRQRRGRSAAPSSTGTTSPCTTGARSRAPRATASAASAASGCSTSCRTAPRRSASSSQFETEFESARTLSRLRPDRRGRRRQLQGAHGAGRRLQARHRRARLQVHLARHPPEIRRRLHLHLRGDRARLDLGARLPVRSPRPRPSSSSARRRPGAASASTA